MIIAISVLSLSVIILQPSIIIANTQTSGADDGGIDKEQQMGVCVVGVRSGCNGNK